MQDPVKFAAAAGESMAAGGASKIVNQAPSASPMPRGTETILVVDDSEAIRVLIKRLLERNGYTVLIAASTGEALELFERNPCIGAVLTDAIMPGGTASDLTTQLSKRRPDVRVIIMSGYTADYIVELGCITSPMTFLNKPFTGETLSRTIREVLDR